jgi:hypothetical protein
MDFLEGQIDLAKGHGVYLSNWPMCSDLWEKNKKQKKKLFNVKRLLQVRRLWELW